MTHRNEAGAERAQNRPGQPNPEDVFEQGRLEAHRQAVEESAALARAHYEVEPGLRAIYRLESADPNDHRIKLLEVNEQTVPFYAHRACGFPVTRQAVSTIRCRNRGHATGVRSHPGK